MQPGDWAWERLWLRWAGTRWGLLVAWVLGHRLPLQASRWGKTSSQGCGHLPVCSPAQDCALPWESCFGVGTPALPGQKQTSEVPRDVAGEDHQELQTQDTPHPPPGGQVVPNEKVQPCGLGER